MAITTNTPQTTNSDFRGFVTELLSLAQHSDTTLGQLVADISGDEDGNPQDTAAQRTITNVRQVATPGRPIETIITLDNGQQFAVTVRPA